MSDIASRIDSYFIEMEWPFERLDEHLWRTAFPGDIQVHQIFLSTDEEAWLSLRTMVCPAPKNDCSAKLNAHLLRLNSLIPLTKFCTMENGDIFALVDLPTADLDFSEFRTALLTLVSHVDTYDNEIVKFCEDTSHVSTLFAKAVV